MEAKYIFAIVILGVFFIVIFFSFVFLEYGRVKEAKLQAWIDEQYDSKEVKKYDYDSTDEDELIAVPKATVADEVTDELEEVKPEITKEDAYGKIDLEGIEEITGNYNGDK